MKKIFSLFAILCSFYMLSCVFADTIPAKGIVTPSVGLNVRKRPSSSSEKLCTLDKGTEVTIESVSGRWYKISSPRSGYVYDAHIKVTDTREEEKTDYTNMSSEERKKIGRNYMKSAANAKVKHNK